MRFFLFIVAMFVFVLVEMVPVRAEESYLDEATTTRLIKCIQKIGAIDARYDDIEVIMVAVRQMPPGERPTFTAVEALISVVGMQKESFREAEAYCAGTPYVSSLTEGRGDFEKVETMLALMITVARREERGKPH